MSAEDLPLLAYGGSSGWSGSEASRQRAEIADRSGETSARQARILALLETAGRRGMTWREVAEATGLHHGSASGALSGLHKGGLIARLAEQRDRCQIYCLPDQIAGRQEEPYSPNPGSRAQALAMLDAIESALLSGMPSRAMAEIQRCREQLA